MHLDFFQTAELFKMMIDDQVFSEKG